MRNTEGGVPSLPSLPKCQGCSRTRRFIYIPRRTRTVTVDFGVHTTH